MVLYVNQRVWRDGGLCSGVESAFEEVGGQRVGVKRLIRRQGCEATGDRFENG